MQAWISQVTERVLKGAEYINSLDEGIKVLADKIEETRDLLLAVLFSTIRINAKNMDEKVKQDIQCEAEENIERAENLMLQIQFLLPMVWWPTESELLAKTKKLKLRLGNI